ncbi:MAG: competence/damage-inducible protein A [Acidobacteria bacterium]|nr:MAG: competence/damage-inducible protein A [Acidobacteriota bacterium]
MDAEIIAVGSELLTPYRLDTNSLYLTEKLNALGIEVRFKTVVGDDRERLARVLRAALDRSNLIILTGGLGPTEDDVNREVVAEALARPLREVAAVRKSLEERFARLGRAMSPNNARQALVPEGAEWLENKKGTAPGLWIEEDGVHILLLPGPPHELEAMFESACLPRLARLSTGERLSSRVYKVVGLPESEVDQRIAPIYKAYVNPTTTILAVAGAIEIHLRARAANEDEAQALLTELGDKIELALGDHVFSTRGESLEQIVAMYLNMKQKSVAVAESCTGGLLSERLTRVPGSSGYFLGGVVCYGNDLKTKLAGVPPALLETHGAVSKPVAQAMAEGIRSRSGANIGIGITGVAGPSGGTPEKPVGLVYISLADERGTQVREFRFPGDRERIRHWATQAALELIRRRMM